MPAWLAELHAEALDLADAKALADESVDIDITHGHLPSSITRPQSDLLDGLGCNERQRLARRSTAGVEMPVTFEPHPGHSLHGLDRPKVGLAGSPEMDRLYGHGSIISGGELRQASQQLGAIAFELRRPDARDRRQLGECAGCA